MKLVSNLNGLSLSRDFSSESGLQVWKFLNPLYLVFRLSLGYWLKMRKCCMNRVSEYNSVAVKTLYKSLHVKKASYES